MNNLAEVLVPIFGIMFLFGAPVAAFIISRVLKHQERIEMIRHGLIPGPDDGMHVPPPFGPRAAAPPPPPPYAMSYNDFAGAQVQLRKGVRVALIGFALLIGLFFIDVSRPGPWLLGGLIPMFVGIAQIIVAMLSGARFGPPVYPQQGAPPPPPEPGRPPTPPPPGNSYAYRPGSTVELEPPAGPPDLR